MFEGLDEIDWDAMDSGFDSARTVPELLREAASDDPQQSDLALCQLADWLHVSTFGYDYNPIDGIDGPRLAAISTPFLLELALNPLHSMRSTILKMIAAIMGVNEHDETQPFRLWRDDEMATMPVLRHRQSARSAVGRAVPDLMWLLADPDADVRRATPLVLAPCAEQWHTVIPALLERVEAESDPNVKLRVVTVLGSIAKGWPDPAADFGIPAKLVELLGDDGDPVGQLIAAVTVLQVNSAALPGGVDRAVVGAVHRLSEVELPELSGSDAWMYGTTNEWMAYLIHSMCDELDNRPEEQTKLLRGLFTAPQPEIRRKSCHMARRLINTWRGDHSTLITSVATQLADTDVWKTAAEELSHLGSAIAPAADHIFAVLDQYPRITELREIPQRLQDRWIPMRWLELHSNHPPRVGPLLGLAAQSGDPRAVQALRWALELDTPPFGLDDALAALGAPALELLPLIRRRMLELHELYPRTPLDDYYRPAMALARGLGRLGAAAAAAAEDVVAILPSDSRILVEVLGRFGPAAGATAPAVRPFLAHSEPRVRWDAAAAWWRLTGDPEPALVLALDAFRADAFSFRATEIAGNLGPAAAACVPHLRRLIDSPERREASHAAIALWRITGEPGPTVTTLLEHSTTALPKSDAERASARDFTDDWLIDAADCFAEIGPAAAAAAPLLATELAHPRRRDTSASHDNNLCRAFRRALDSIFAI
ncbi:hypothetical protein [Nocardia sp. NBC_01009]|uniref:hypothetical protein n=1 Tax=Nocardia sp. NBC_01009 TaxID=2975996 RepID=UPI003866FFE7|nr:hypothetical protein OHA42_02750 [Nocardia sp. NBC_01009]